MKKKLLSLVCVASLLLLYPASAAAALPKISTAMDCMAADAVLVKSGEYGSDVFFSAKDFAEALGVSTVKSVTVAALPSPDDGVLMLGSLSLSEGQTVLAENLTRLRFIPVSELTEKADFRFRSDDFGGGADMLCEIRYAEKKNHAPVAVTDAGLSVFTQKSIAVFGNMKATDEDGDRLTYEIMRYPKRGTLYVSDKESGEFRYTPSAEYTGEDSFVFRARDEYGHYSAATTVTIKIADRTSELTLADMTGHPAHIAVLAAVEAGILTPISEDNGELCFFPDREMTNAEFTVALMKAAGIRPLSYEKTAFDDNDAIPPEYIPYIATAQGCGAIHGNLTENGLCFCPDDAITAARAASLLVAFGLVDADSSTISTISAAPDVSLRDRAAVAACASDGLFDRISVNAFGDALTRGDAAMLLSSFLPMSK